jgi:hypothetical protein
MTTRLSLLALVLLTPLSGCRFQDRLTLQEAQQASEELKISSQAQALTSNTVEIGTHFTIGEAVQQAASTLREFVQTELPCADVTLADQTLTVVYGVQAGCEWNGQTITGTHEITVSRNDDDDVVVDHVWTDLTNGKVQVSGTAEVTWSWTSSDPNRHVVHDLVWTRLSDGRTGQGKGDRTQRPLPDGGLAVGFVEEGHRSWDGRSGHWDLDVSGLEMRWVDPVPQSGNLTLDTPFDKTVSVDFSRVDANTIKVTVEGPHRSFDVNVNSLQ